MSAIELRRDCSAIQIPQGEPFVLPEGSEVYLTQTLGGTFTVRAQQGLFRISGQDADALGLPIPEGDSVEAVEPDAGAGELNEERVWSVLRTCYDPEIPVNIVDLGLVYDLGIEAVPGSDGHKVFVKMTLTAPGCGMGTVIAQDAQDKILNLPKVADACVEIVWDPPWHQSMITAEGRRILGL